MCFCCVCCIDPRGNSEGALFYGRKKLVGINQAREVHLGNGAVSQGDAGSWREAGSSPGLRSDEGARGAVRLALHGGPSWEGQGHNTQGDTQPWAAAPCALRGLQPGGCAGCCRRPIPAHLLEPAHASPLADLHGQFWMRRLLLNDLSGSPRSSCPLPCPGLAEQLRSFGCGPAILPEGQASF